MRRVRVGVPEGLWGGEGAGQSGPLLSQPALLQDSTLWT